MSFNKNPEIQAAYDELPEAIRNAIAASKWEERLREISRDNKLHLDTAAQLETETMIVLLGLEDSAAFPANVERELKLTHADAQKIVKEVDDGIFVPIRESLISQNPDLAAEDSGRTGESTIAEPKEETEEELDAEKILAEIENPVPVKNPTDTDPTEREETEAAETPAAAAIKTPPEAPLPPAPPKPPALYAEKLSIAMSTPATEKNVEMPRTPILEKKNYAVDPYREQPK